MKAIATISGGIDSFASAVIAKRFGYEIVEAVYIDLLQNEKDLLSAQKTAELLKIPLKVIKVEGLRLREEKRVVAGLPFKYAISIVLSASYTASAGYSYLIASEVSFSFENKLYVKQLKELLMTSPITQPGVVLLTFTPSVEEEVEILKSFGITKENYFFTTCNSENECGRCVGCKKKARILSLI